MKATPVLAAAAALAVITPAVARAQAPDVTPDVKCVVAAIALTQSTDPQIKSLAQIASVYYLGKVDKGAPGIDLEAQIRAVVTTMAPAAYLTEAQRCAQDFQTRAVAVQAIFQHLKASPPAAGAAGAPPKP